MATILNERDIQLQGTTPRLLVVPTNNISIVPSTNTFATTSSGIVPANTNIIALINGILTGTIVWSTSPTTPYTTITNSINILGSDIAIGSSVTVTASITYLGNVYSSSTIISRAANSSIITLEQTAANINKSSLGVFTPATVVFSGKVVDGANPPAVYAGRLVVDITTDGSTYSNLYTSATNESSYTYTPNVTHKAVRVKLYAAGGVTTLLDQKSTSISENGTTGSDGSIFYITPSSYVLSKNQNNVFSPSNIVFSAKSKVGSSPATAYSGRFKIYENGSGTASYSSSSDEVSTNYIPTTSCTSIKVELYQTGGFVTKLDEQGITITLAGAHAISAVLTNEAHVMPADASGAVTSYANSGTLLYVYEGGNAIPYDEAGYSLGTPNTWKVTTTVANIAAGAKSDGGTYAEFGTCSGMANGVDTGSITFNISGISSIGVNFTTSKTQSLSKSKEGAEGPPGPSDTSNLLKLNTSNILTGTVVPQDTGGFKVGSITWNSVTGALSGGTGIAITEWGIIGGTSGVPTFTIQAATGAATFLGDITGGSNINISGIANFQGATNSGGVSYCGVFNESRTTTGGVSGTAGSSGFGVRGSAGTSGTIGVSGTGGSSSGAEGVRATQGTAGGLALNVVGPMAITNTSVVSNLNADMVDGKHATDLCSIVATQVGNATVGGSGFVLSSTVSNVRTRAGGGNTVIIESFSDERLKENILPETLGLDFINRLLPVEFNVLRGSDLKYHGFIYQDVKKLINGDKDSLSHIHSDGMGAVDYMSMVGPIVKAMQELHEETKQLKSQVQTLIKKIQILENK